MCMGAWQGACRMRLHACLVMLAVVACLCMGLLHSQLLVSGSIVVWFMHTHGHLLASVAVSAQVHACMHLLKGRSSAAHMHACMHSRIRVQQCSVHACSGGIITYSFSLACSSEVQSECANVSVGMLPPASCAMQKPCAPST